MDTYITDHESCGELLPTKGGALWLAEILRQTDLKRDQLRTNNGLRNMLMEYAIRNNLAYSSRGSVEPAEEESSRSHAGEEFVPAKILREAQQRLAERERRCAELRAENVGLRAQLASSSEIAELISFGRRIGPGSLDDFHRAEEDEGA